MRTAQKAPGGWGRPSPRGEPRTAVTCPQPRSGREGGPQGGPEHLPLGAAAAGKGGDRFPVGLQGSSRWEMHASWPGNPRTLLCWDESCWVRGGPAGGGEGQSGAPRWLVRGDGQSGGPWGPGLKLLLQRRRDSHSEPHPLPVASAHYPGNVFRRLLKTPPRVSKAP